ncbi:hypothetical protein BASA61_009146 [Batrachochytrium salamandrivorans]|nr:hypothetical protein BASA62_009699 [Batrachochytrium salamandrivorans]KAH6581296.1 hypothetical protein BASA61_009146 [Batrachochytrium salamandrivorans]KAH9250042.1 hypothetical protein BASA81_012175 [Batrachochytrium salamandrivorans]
MKFNALVAAAMVITSVNAGLLGRIASVLRRNDRMTISGSSRGLLRKKWDASQDLDHTNNKDVHDLAKHDIYEDPECNALFIILHGLQDNISILSGKYRKSKATISRLHIKVKNSKSKKADKYCASYSLTSTTMKEIRLKAIILRKGHAEFWKDFSNAQCPAKLNQLSPPDEIGKIEMFLGDPMESSDCESIQKTDA